MDLKYAKTIISLYISIFNGTYKSNPIFDLPENTVSSLDVEDNGNESEIFYEGKQLSFLNDEPDENQLSLLENMPAAVNHTEKNSILTVEVKKMKLYGRIETQNYYYNFFPQYIDEGDGIVAIRNVEERFPTRGGINLAASHISCKSFLDKLNVPEHNDSIQKIYVVEILESDLQDNDNDKRNYITKKIDLDDIVKNGRKINNIIYPIETENFYRVAEPTFPNNGNIFADNTLEIMESEYSVGELVLLASSDKVYGLFKVIQGYADKKFISLNIRANNYLVNYRHVDECKKLEFEKKRYLYDESPLVLVMYEFGSVHSKEDVIPDNVLLEKLKDDIRPELAVESPDEFVRIYSNNPFLSTLPDDIRKSRTDRVRQLITSSSSYQDTLKELLTVALERNEFQIPDSLIESSDIYKKQLDKSAKLSEKNEDLQKRIDEMNNELKEISIALPNNSDASNEEVERQQKKKIEELEAQLARYQKNETLYQSVEELKNQQSELRAQNKMLLEDVFQKKQESKELEKKIQQESKELEKKIQDAITNGFESSANMAVEPYIYHTMLQKASEWALSNDADNFRKYADIFTKHQADNLAGDALISELIKRVQNKRNYSVNDILNIYISLIQNFITVFSGEPGIGKTSICGIIAESLGLNCFGKADDGTKLDRFIHVSVERGWQSKRDLIGYFNPLTRKYDRSNNGIYDALRTLDAEGDTSKFPFFILLDEANLSPLEYYWSDFIHLADEHTENLSINIGSDTNIQIPNTLHFMATINNDQTTEQLSPRFIDRATIIKLPTVALKLSGDKNNYEPVSWENLIKVFDNHDENKSNPLIKVLDEIYELFRKYNMNASPRVRISINRYIDTAQRIMENENGIRNYEKAMDYAVLQRLIPKINGSFDFYKPMFDKLKQICDENNLQMTLNAIETMEKLQAENMGYCQYLM